MRSWTIAASGLLLLTIPTLGCSSAPSSDNEGVQLQPAKSAVVLNPMEQLGDALYFDKSLSSPPNQACADCHGPHVGWTGPNPGINASKAVYPGAVHRRFGNRKPPSAAYATTSPVLREEEVCFFVGGNFSDGRATGDVLGNPAADQAMGPFLNPVEQNNESEQAVCEKVANARYAGLFEDVWGPGTLDCSDAGVEGTYYRIALSIAAFEDSPAVNAYTSKFDYYQRGMVELTANEAWGLELFDGKGKCAACHLGPEFTDYTYDNLGVPRNPDNPFYEMDDVYMDGEPINPMGEDWVDLGLGGYLASLPDEHAWRACADENLGKHKVPTLRNVALRPGPGFTKAYTHNGVFHSLEDVVHFYNTRDVEDWPASEVASNINTDELGNLGLTRDEERAIVAFMQTLSDGYPLE